MSVRPSRSDECKAERLRVGAARHRVLHRNARCGCDVAEAARAVVHEQREHGSLEPGRRAVGAADPVERVVHAAVDRGVPLDVVRDHGVEVAVRIDIEEAGRGPPLGLLGKRCAFERDRARRGCPVEEERVLADAGDEEIGRAVSIDVAGGETHRVDVGEERRIARDALERERPARGSRVAVDADAALPRRRIACGGLERLPLREDEVERAIAVEVHDRDPAAEALGQQFAAARA
jgi:hypothetical protein